MTPLRFAIGTNDGTLLNNDHVGSAERYRVYRVTDEEVVFEEDRRNVAIEEDETLAHGDPKKAAAMGSLLKDLDGIVGKRFGPNVKRMLHRFVCVRTRVDTVAEAVALLEAHKDELSNALDAGQERSLLVLQPD
ncbi:MAG: hypothetical protein J7M25_18245 [Deltaproteobacteria bacterium]|nr:hypothetical protein [Deltaproteobacteria bacterium]